MNNQAGIANYAKDASQRASSNLHKLLLWIFMWGWSTENVIQALLGLKRRPCCDYVKRGVLRRVEPPPGFPAVYVLGHAYLDLAHSLYETSKGIPIPYPFHRQAIPFAEQVLHNQGAQLCALRFLKEDDFIVCEREFRLKKQKNGLAIPDFSITKGLDASIVYYEYERTPKFDLRLVHQLQLRAEALQAGSFSEIVWCCSREGIMRNIVNALEKDYLPRVEKGPDGSLEVTKRLIDRWYPAELSRHSRFAIEGIDF